MHELRGGGWRGGCALDNGALRLVARLMSLSNSLPGGTLSGARGKLPTRRYTTICMHGMIYGSCTPPLTLKCEMSRRCLIASR